MSDIFKAAKSIAARFKELENKLSDVTAQNEALRVENGSRGTPSAAMKIQVQELTEQLAAVTKERDALESTQIGQTVAELREQLDSALNDLNFRRELYKLQAKSLGDVIADNASLAEDKARLDWMDRSLCGLDCHEQDHEIKQTYWQASYSQLSEKFTSVRAAIDAARKEQP